MLVSIVLLGLTLYLKDATSKYVTNWDYNNIRYKKYVDYMIIFLIEKICFCVNK